MNDKEIESCMTDNSSSVTFNINICCENGRLSPQQRKAVAGIVNRAVTTMSLSLERVVEGRFDMGLEKKSSAHGVVSLDTGATIDEG